jgi:PAS domain-containing protein
MESPGNDDSHPAAANRCQIASGASESEELYRKLFDLAPDAILILTEGRIMLANPACMNLAGARLELLESRRLVS